MKTIFFGILGILGFLLFSGDTMLFAVAMLIAGLALPVFIAIWIFMSMNSKEKKSK
jgi:hypothetical protein